MEDFEFVFRLNETNMRNCVEGTRGWDEEAERRAVRGLFRPGVDEIIVIDGHDAGVFGVDRRKGEIELRHIEILPAYQGKGIGSSLTRDLLDEARAKNFPVGLQVTKSNPARRLYQRLGFRVSDETETKYRMVALPG